MFGTSLYFLLVLVVVLVVSNADDLVLDNEENPIKTFQKWPIKAARPVENVTSTIFFTSTTVTSSFATLFCATTASVTGPCRRRRGIEEQPILVSNDGEMEQIAKKLQPTEVQSIELTMMPAGEIESDFDLSGSQVTISDDETTLMPEEINSDILQRAKPFIFNRFKVKSTIILTETLTSTHTVTVTSATKTFTISGCVPADFSDFSCPFPITRVV